MDLPRNFADRIQGEESCALKIDDKILPMINIRFQNLCYSVKKEEQKATLTNKSEIFKDKKVLLKSLNGEFRAGELTAIMGPSGTGKSTLMNILAGFKRHSGGDVLVNEKKRNLNQFRRQSCYIMQRDELCPLLSVLELMRYAANLKLGNLLTSKEKEYLIDEILESLSLFHTKATRTPLLSGGEKKRLAIALELINNPPCMFFDEPTSGLDSSSAFQCISLMQRLAREGRTIVCVIHQPSSSIFEMFDQLYLLAKGHCIYQGPTMNVISFLSETTGVICPLHHSAADYAIDIAIEKYGKDAVNSLIEKIKSGSSKKTSNATYYLNASTQHENRTTKDEKTFYKRTALQTFEKESDPFAGSDTTNRIHTITCYKNEINISGWTQFSEIFRKTTICILRHRVLTGVRIGLQLLLAFMAALVYENIGNNSSQVLNNIGLMLFSQVVYGILGLLTTVMAFPMERPLLVREKVNDWYRLDMYYLAKTCADIPFEIAFTSLYVVIVFFMTNQPLVLMRFLMFWGMGIMSSLVSQSIGLSLGAALSIRPAIFLGPIVVVPCFLFSGGLIKFSEIPSYLRWISYLSFVRYGYEGSINSIYSHDRPPLECKEDFCYQMLPIKILTWLNMEDSVYWIDFTGLAVLFIAMRFLTFFILRWKLNSKF